MAYRISAALFAAFLATPASAQTEIQWWHAMAGELGQKIEKLATDFNASQPDWKVEHGYLVDIQGRPCVRTKLEIYPAADFVAKSFSDFMVLGMIMTAMPAVYAIPRVVEAPAGIVTYADLPLVLPRGLVAR